MTPASPARPFEVRHVQLARAAFAALAAVMITFSPDHSAVVGLSVFSGFAIATALVLFAAVWLVYPAGRRWPAMLLATATLLAGMAGGLEPLRTTVAFFAIVVAWALLTGVIEGASGIVALRALRPRAPRPGHVEPWDGGPAAPPTPRGEARDAVVVGILTVLLGLALLLVPTGYALSYTIQEAGTFTLTGIIIAVGIFGGYAAILAVYLGIAGFSPRTPAAEPAEAKDAA